MESVQGKMLLIAPNWIGDAVLSLPVVQECRSLFPEADLAILARGVVAELLTTCGLGLRVISFQKGTGLGRLRQVWKTGTGLRQEGFDWAIILPNSLGAAIVAAVGGIRRRIGYRGDCRGWLLTHSLPARRKERGLHQADYYLALLTPLGVRPKPRRPQLQVPDSLRARAAAIMQEHGVEAGEVVVGVHPGAAYGEAKRWLPQRFAAVLERLQRQGARAIILGAPGEEKVAGEITAAMGTAPVDLVGKTSIGEAAALVERCDLFLSNDSGLMHVAAALGRPQVALFGSTDPAKTAPLNQRAVVIHPEEVECSPCFRRTCPRNLECMEAISVAAVTSACERQLQGAAAGICRQDQGPAEVGGR